MVKPVLQTLVASAMMLATGGWPAFSVPNLGGTIILYENEGLQGRSITLSSDSPFLGTQNFNDLTSSLVIQSGTWQLCEDANFQGRCQLFNPGTYFRMATAGLNNDALSSLRLVNTQPPGQPNPPQGSLTLYENFNFKGAAVTLNQTSFALGTIGFNDRTNSLIVTAGIWQLCEDTEGGGRCVQVNPGQYANVLSLGLGSNAVSSVRLVTSSGPGGWPTSIPIPPTVTPRPIPTGYDSTGCPPNFYRRGDSCVIYNSPLWMRDRALENK